MSKYLVSARKYRPVTFDQLIGQDHISRTLKNAIRNNKLAHAFLFCGPRGVGKTTSARILAKVINCENPQNDGTDPCNSCSSCKSFNENASFNILELDAASNNSVDHIRSLTEQVRFQPQQGNFKVFIIDEVHMLSSQAFNAFLKTLEEPPAHAVFILATTEKHKILPTILSRCQIFDFKRIQNHDIVEQLESINKAEGRTAELEALHLIASKSDGAMRDALSIYDKIAGIAGDRITYKDVVNSLNVLDYDYYFNVTDALLQKDLSSALLILDDIIKKGFEANQFIEGLSEHMRNILVCKDPRTLSILEVSPALREKYHNQSTAASHSFLLSALHILNQCDISLPRAQNKRLYTEIALGKINYMSNRVEDETFMEKKTEVVTSKEKLLQSPSHSNVSQQPVTIHPVKSDKSANTKAINHSTLQPKNENPKKDKETNSPSKAQKDTSKMASADLVNTPVISNFSSLINRIKDEEDEKKLLREKISLESIHEIWESYTTNTKSKSLKAALKLAHKALDNRTLIIQVPNGLNRNMILQESDLIERIRNELGMEDLIFDIRVNKEMFPDYEELETKKVLSNKEKYIMMRNINPLIDDLRHTFDLKVDKP